MSNIVSDVSILCIFQSSLYDAFMHGPCSVLTSDVLINVC